MVQLNDLPTEILIEICKAATDNPARPFESQGTWTPFESACSTTVFEECRGALRTKATLPLVCSLFRRLSLELLYEDIWINHGSDGLLAALEVSKNGQDPGLCGYVKRITISLDDGGESRQTRRSIYKNSRRIFLCCPNIRAISHFRRLREDREDGGGCEYELTGGFPFDDLDLPFLQRVDWHNMPFNTPLASAPSPRFIWHSHSLQVLMIGADEFPIHTDRSDQEIIIDLPNLHTLGIFSTNTFRSIFPRREHISLPSIRRLFIARPDAINNFFAGCLAPMVDGITTLEIGPDPHFLRHDFVAAILGYCPTVTELYIPVVTTRPLSRNAPQTLFFAFSVRQVFLYVGAAGKHMDKDPRWWVLLQGHFEGLNSEGTRLPVLERIVLCGWEWKDTLSDERFVPILRPVRAKGIRIDCDIADLHTGLSNLLETLKRRVSG
ncbi:uncharacterized protein FOMMEDRAFT_151018 [Fomitiporia mediterranea MF3/22]|uniref:uncharacterized protein n=1 Tax=Fomitiporia mediterranea (strain MF3/22) TaxID=694068 RepID=UPI0004408B57|nr:uncharacterized protein FOMMEDRAFT_151018 [Fomitiporia mediterranea MF3/22]EJD08271.1 hypothetical protein FOMMEDRAFT_151018 [Fomitiporia mediterranea MF3/22]